MFDVEKSKAERIGDCRFEPELRDKIRKYAGRHHLTVAAYVRSSVLEYMEDHPLKDLPPPPPESVLSRLPEIRPEAMIYQVPINGAKIVVSKTETGWKGIVYHPEKSGSVAVWDSENFALPTWAKTPHVIRAFNFLGSRIENDGVTYFRMPNGTFITSNWDGHHFTGGEVIDTKTQRRQSWVRSGAFSLMEPGPFNNSPNIRRMQNMLCAAFPAGDKKSDGTLP